MSHWNVSGCIKQTPKLEQLNKTKVCFSFLLQLIKDVLDSQAALVPKGIASTVRLVTPTTTASSGLSQQRKGREKTHICFSHLVPTLLYPSTPTQVAEISYTVSLKSKDAVM